MATATEAADADTMLWRTRLRQADRNDDRELYWTIWGSFHAPNPPLPVLDYETQRVEFLRAVGIDTFVR